MKEDKIVVRKYLGEEQAAEYLCVAEGTMRDWRMKGRINNKGEQGPVYYKRGKHIYYEIHELDEWVSAGASR